MLARDVMTTEIATVRQDASIIEAIAVMQRAGVSGLPVVGADDKIVGVLTEGDLLRRVETDTTGSTRRGWLDALFGGMESALDYVRTHSRLVEDVMTPVSPDFVSVTEDTPLSEVAARMEHHQVKRVPVLRHGELVGIVSRSDLVRALGRALQTEASGAVTDDSIRQRLYAEISKEDWFPPGLGVAVNQGVVTFQGIVSNQQARDALRVAARNTPGVKAVEDKLQFVDPSAAMMF